MASKLKKLSCELNIDEALTCEGAESELSLADDCDEFSNSFSGTLSLSLSQSFPDESSKRRLLNSDESPVVGDIPFASVDHEKQQLRTRVTFEIINARIIKEGRNKHVGYSIHLVRPAGPDTSQAVIERRYSDFENLHTALKRLHPSLMTDISFPTKKVTGNFKAETIARRSRAFEQYLTHVYSIDLLRLSSEFAAFFYENDLQKAYQLMKASNYKESLEIFRTAAHLQQKLLGDDHPAVISTMCAIVALCCEQDQDKLAQGFAEAALQCIGSSDHNEFLVPLLQTSIRLCWKLGKDKKDLEARLQRLRDKGISVEVQSSLLEVVLSRNQRW